jgi:hypothetical protein
MKEKIFVEKVSIDDLLDALEFLYDKGAEFVDILIVKNSDEDNEDLDLLFSAKDEYYMNVEDEEQPPTKLSDDNLDNFIL